MRGVFADITGPSTRYNIMLKFSPPHRKLKNNNQGGDTARGEVQEKVQFIAKELPDAYGLST